MANSTVMFGFQPVKHATGIDWNGSTRKYYIPATQSGALFIGDPVVRTSAGANAAVAKPGINSFAIGRLPIITQVAAGHSPNPITGVIVAFEPDPDALRLRQHNLTLTERVALVCDDPGVIFHARDDGTGSALTATATGINADVAAGAGGNTVTGASSYGIDNGGVTTPAANIAYQLLIRKIAELDDNVIGANAIWEVLINTHTEARGVGVAGI